MKKNKPPKFEFSDEDVYEILRTSTTQIAFDYFCNYVTYSADKKTITINVDNSYENYYAMKADDGDFEQNFAVTYFTKRNERFFKYLNEKYTIKNSLFRLNNKLPLNNVLSGSTVEIGIGEGILDFIYADFISTINSGLSDYSLLKKELKKQYPDMKIIYRSKPFGVQDQDTEEEYQFYIITARLAASAIYSSIYSAVAPPVFHIDSKDAVLMCFKYYAEYLVILQNEYLELIEFCFDENFYPNVLGKLSPVERYALYRKLKHLPTELERFEVFRIYDRPENVGDLILEITPEEKELAEKFKFNTEELVKELTHSQDLDVSYRIRSIRGLLELEFTKILEQNIRFRKCKRCGMYFIMKGNYDTNYCDRILYGETKNCQDIMAMEKYKQKWQTTPPSEFTINTINATPQG